MVLNELKCHLTDEELNNEMTEMKYRPSKKSMSSICFNDRRILYKTKTLLT